MKNAQSRSMQHDVVAVDSDRGFTLPEVLIAVLLMSLLAAVLAAAMTVTLRQAASTEGRANVARAETAIDTWLPVDLGSTDLDNDDLPALTDDPAATPCGNCGTIDLGGTNAMQLAWENRDDSGAIYITRVQYQYFQEADGEWVIRRIECVGSDRCTVSVVLHDLDGPPDAGFTPGSQRPTWVFDVDVPVDDDATLSGNARQISVTIDGGGAADGAGGGLNTINLTSGGRSTEEIPADEFDSPSFTRATSRCGGPVTLIVDDSGSIGSNVNKVVKPGVKAFIDAFRGTPTRVQVIRFSTRAEAIGPGDGWHRYIDMTNDAQVDQLIAAVDTLSARGYTNWEDAFFHTFKESDGSPAAILPNRVVFFTDGMPTINRHTPDGTFGAGFDASNGDVVDYNDGPYDRSVGWPNPNGGSFNQESWDRADVIIDQHRNTDMVFVGVGSSLTRNISWIHEPAAYAFNDAPPAPSQTIQASETISRLVANGPTGHVPAIFDGDRYTNPETADFYLQTSFDADAFAEAMKAAALKDCGGTVTIQTRLADGSAVDDEFVYENAATRDDDGNAVPGDARRVTTSSSFRTGTFDFEIPAGNSYFTADIVPQDLQTLTGYTPVGWSCRAGAQSKTLQPIPIDGSTFTGFSVDVRPNEAVSCVLQVTR